MDTRSVELKPFGPTAAGATAYRTADGVGAAATVETERSAAAIMSMRNHTGRHRNRQ
jgi:hypothetical protein